VTNASTRPFYTVEEFESGARTRARLRVHADRAMFYYFGMVIGFLLYVMILGFPQLGG
jgi:hypothetical protein